jgi:hypothetical protein
VDTTSTNSTTSSFPSSSFFPIANMPADHWHETYFAWQNRVQFQQQRQQNLEMQQLRMFGGEPGEDVSLLEPMLRVVTDLFDGNTDYEDP